MITATFNPFPQLVTERLVLRRIELTDVNEIFFMRSDPRVMQYINKARCQTTDEAQAFIQRITDAQTNNDSVMWAISLKENPTLIGTVCLWNMQKEHDRAELGYAIHPDHQGKGLMQEVVTNVLKYGFDGMKLHSVEAHVNPENVKSIALLERNGFVREGYFKENWFYEGKFLDSAIYSLLAPGR